MNTLRVSRIVRRAMLPVALLLGGLLWWSYGTFTVPIGMDTLLADYPPGTICVVSKHPATIVPGSVVFFDYGSGTLISRVARIEGEKFWVEHDDRSRYPDGDELGPQPLRAIRGLVLSGFRPDTPIREGDRGKR